MVPTGMKSQLQRTALKDIRNEPALTSGPHMDSWKGQMSDLEGGSLLLQRPKARKGSVHFEDDVRPAGGQNTTKDAQASANRQQFSPKGFSTSKVPFFPDPSIERENEGPECAEVTLNCTNKYFSTPITTKGRAKKKLSPVMEVDTESNTAPKSNENRAYPMGSVQKSPEGADAAPSSPETPPYRNSFLMECQQIVKQIKGSGNDRGASPGKRKAEELDVSGIDTEPPPYDSTPFKSMLAWEVSHMISSLENSPQKDGTSLFGESLLDLERTDMQLQDFNLSDFGNNRKGRSVKDSVVTEILYSGDEVDGECSIKRQKMSPASDMFHCKSNNTSIANCSPVPGTRQNVTPPRGTITLSTSLILEELRVANMTEEINCDGADSLHVSGVLEDITSHVPELVAKEDVTSTTQDIYEPANATQVIEWPPQQLSMLNTTEVLEPSPQSVCNITQEIALVAKETERVNTTIEIKAEPQASTSVMQHTVSIIDEVATAANSTWVGEEEPPTSVASVQDVVFLNVRDSPANTTQVIILQTADTTQAIVSKHEGSIINTTQVIDVVPEYSPNTASAHQSSKSANSTQVITPVPDDLGNRTQDVVMVLDERAEKDICVSIVNIAPSDTGATADVTTDVTSPANQMMQVRDGATEDGFVQDGNIDKAAFSPAMPDLVPHIVPHIVLEDVGASGDVLSAMADGVGSPVQSSDNKVSPKVVQTSAPSPDVVHESRKLPGSPTDSGNISGCPFSPEKEVVILSKADNIDVPHAEGQAPVSDVTHTDTDHGTPVGISTQSKPDSQDSASNDEGNDIQIVALASSPNEVPPTVLNGRLSPSESCSMIQEEENVHDVSVFSAGSLSFVTSTPVLGLNNFPFLKSCKDPEQHDPNMSLGCVVEPLQKKDLTEDCMTAQCKLKASMQGNDGHKQIRGIPGPQRSALPSQMSAIPSARRALALFHNPAGHGLGKDSTLSKIPPKGIPMKGTTRPPLARQSLASASMGNIKQNMEGKVGTMAPSKITGSSFKSPKVVPAKPRSAALPSKLPGAPSLGNAPSQICTPSSGGFAGTQNVTADVQDLPSGSHAAPSVGVKSFLPKPGSSSLHPPLPMSSQKTLLKPKSNLPGSSGRRSQLPGLGAQKKIVPVKAEGSLIKRQLKPPSSGAQVAPTREAVSKVAAKPNIPTPRTQQIKAQPSAESLTLPLPDKAEPECCCSLETCPCCQRWCRRYQTLLQENEDLKRQRGRVRPESDC